MFYEMKIFLISYTYIIISKINE